MSDKDKLIEDLKLEIAVKDGEIEDLRSELSRLEAALYELKQDYYYDERSIFSDC